ncbi:MAG: hypothetical protein QOG90_1121 [Actinomycetota bacterium]
MRGVAVVLALATAACGGGFRVRLSTGDTTTTTAASASSSLLPTTYEGGAQRFDPPDGVTARMTAQEAYAAWDKQQDPPTGASQPEIFFALYTDFGRGHMLDNGHVSHEIDRIPVWVIRWRDVPTDPRFGSGGAMGFRETPPSTSPPTTFLQDYVEVINDANGESLVGLQSRPDEPAAPMRSWDATPTGKPCPADVAQYGAPGLVDDGGTIMPIGNGMKETMPRGVVKGSNGDVYTVWGGAGSVEHMTNGAPEDAPDGVIVVVHHGPDPCAHPRPDEGLIVFHHEPSATGIVTLTAIDGDLVRYRTKGGVTGWWNVVTEQFSAQR